MALDEDVRQLATGPEAREHIDACSRRYRGTDYTPTIVSERVILQITPDRVNRRNL